MSTNIWSGLSLLTSGQVPQLPLTSGEPDCSCHVECAHKFIADHDVGDDDDDDNDDNDDDDNDDDDNDDDDNDDVDNDDGGGERKMHFCDAAATSIVDSIPLWSEKREVNLH